MSEHHLIGRDMFLRYVDADGLVCVRAHRVWDAALFLKALAEAAQANERAPAGSARLARVHVLTEAAFRLEEGRHAAAR